MGVTSRVWVEVTWRAWKWDGRRRGSEEGLRECPDCRPELHPPAGMWVAQSALRRTAWLLLPCSPLCSLLPQSLGISQSCGTLIYSLLTLTPLIMKSL